VKAYTSWKVIHLLLGRSHKNLHNVIRLVNAIRLILKRAKSETKSRYFYSAYSTCRVAWYYSQAERGSFTGNFKDGVRALRTLLGIGDAGDHGFSHRVAASTPSPPPQAPKYLLGISPYALNATLGSVPGACVLWCSLHNNRLRNRALTLAHTYIFHVLAGGTWLVYWQFQRRGPCASHAARHRRRWRSWFSLRPCGLPREEQTNNYALRSKGDITTDPGGGKGM